MKCGTPGLEQSRTQKTETKIHHSLTWPAQNALQPYLQLEIAAQRLLQK